MKKLFYINKFLFISVIIVFLVCVVYISISFFFLIIFLVWSRLSQKVSGYLSHQVWIKGNIRVIPVLPVCKVIFSLSIHILTTETSSENECLWNRLSQSLEVNKEDDTDYRIKVHQ